MNETEWSMQLERTRSWKFKVEKFEIKLERVILEDEKFSINMKKPLKLESYYSRWIGQYKLESSNDKKERHVQLKDFVGKNVEFESLMLESFFLSWKESREVGKLSLNLKSSKSNLIWDTPYNYAKNNSARKVNGHVFKRQKMEGLKQGKFNDLGFHGPPTPAGQRLCGFNKGL